MEKSSSLKNFFKVLLFLGILAGIIYGLQYYYHILDKPIKLLNNPIKQFNTYIERANRIADKDMVWGISTGTVFFLAVLIIIPVMTRKINTRSYFKNLFQGVISTFIFFITQMLYGFFAKIGKFYLLLTIVGVAILTLILIKVVVGIYKKEEDKVEFRTTYVASITAGLIFSILLQLVMLWSNWIKANIHLNVH